MILSERISGANPGERWTNEEVSRVLLYNHNCHFCHGSFLGHCGKRTIIVPRCSRAQGFKCCSGSTGNGNQGAFQQPEIFLAGQWFLWSAEFNKKPRCGSTEPASTWVNG